nr:hypothetical protein CPGR_02550 [Mycolicibacterium malmesburyense]
MGLRTFRRWQYSLSVIRYFNELGVGDGPLDCDRYYVRSCGAVRNRSRIVPEPIEVPHVKLRFWLEVP